MKFLFVTLINFIVSIANVFLYPVNTAVSSAFPSFAQNITDFTSLCTRYLGSGLAYFFSMLPPNTRNLVLLYLSLLLICYTVSFSVHLITKIIQIIKQVKIW